jgi:hypothetical protein
MAHHFLISKPHPHAVQHPLFGLLGENHESDLFPHQALCERALSFILPRRGHGIFTKHSNFFSPVGAKRFNTGVMSPAC